jgi:hypothetical protein
VPLSTTSPCAKRCSLNMSHCGVTTGGAGDDAKSDAQQHAEGVSAGGARGQRRRWAAQAGARAAAESRAEGAVAPSTYGAAGHKTAWYGQYRVAGRNLGKACDRKGCAVS